MMQSMHTCVVDLVDPKCKRQN